MIDTKDFWNHLCVDLGYRFFSGVPCNGLKLLYDTMDAEIMYYVPAVDERIAIRIASGVAMSGDKAGVLVRSSCMENIKDIIKFNDVYEVPILFIVYEDREILSPYNIVKADVGLGDNDFKKVLKRVDNYINKYRKSKMLVITEGVLLG